MPRQNWVTPFGDLTAVKARGDFMGNRGCLHDDNEQIVRWRNGKRWIICETSFGGQKLELMKPGHYTVLFFLDEATGLAAGHRPCNKCRPEAAKRFRKAWTRAKYMDERPDLQAIDRELDEERRVRNQRRVFHAVVAELPNGAFVDLDGVPNLVLAGQLLPWTPSGYGALQDSPRRNLPVITPWSTVQAITAGYRPELHHSAPGSPKR